eukprot:4423202-Heterocapsa_arctica.AAC.1
MASARPRKTSPRTLRFPSCGALSRLHFRSTWAGLPGAWVRVVCCAALGSRRVLLRLRRCAFALGVSPLLGPHFCPPACPRHR